MEKCDTKIISSKKENLATHSQLSTNYCQSWMNCESKPLAVLSAASLEIEKCALLTGAQALIPTLYTRFLFHWKSNLSFVSFMSSMSIVKWIRCLK